MRQLIRMPFLFFLLAAGIGLLLRYHFNRPLDWLKFPFWLHAHSHMMFLGWILNFLCIAFVRNSIRRSSQKKFVALLWLIQALLAAMLISFPLQGYGVASIVLSTLHTVAMTVFTIWFFAETKREVFTLAGWLAKISLILFLISSLGPLMLGPIMASGNAHTQWYYFAVYYYLHFQYNGTFTFGIASLFFFHLTECGCECDKPIVRKFGTILLVSAFPTYALSTLWADPGTVINVIGMAGMALQITALVLLVYILKAIPSVQWNATQRSVRALLTASFVALLIKTLLQTASALPLIARMAYENRNYVMAYLHLVLLGMISSFLLASAIQQRTIAVVNRFNLTILAVGFVGMELSLILPLPIADQSFFRQLLLLIFSAFIFLGAGRLFFKLFERQA